MKKLIIAATVICLTVASQAATANWKATARSIYNGTGLTDASGQFSGTAYIFDAGIIAQSSLYSAISATISAGSAFDATKADGYVASGTVANGSLPNSTAFAYGDQSADASNLKNYSFYFILLDGDNVYFSTEKAISANATDTAKVIAFGSQTNSSIVPTTAGEYAGAGKWSSVPEPTSAMLLMLGLCGLALKRKNA